MPEGMINIFIAVFSFALAFAFFSDLRQYATLTGHDRICGCPISFFVSYCCPSPFRSLPGLLMANAGAAGTMPKGVEVDLKEKGTDLHARQSWATRRRPVQNTSRLL